MNEPRLQISDAMRAILDYPKFAGSTRMLVLETEYYFDKSWARAAEQLGWETASVSSAMVGGLTREQIAELFRTIGEFKPDFIITSNYAGMDSLGLFARFFEDAKIPYVSWFTDTPRMILYERVVHASRYAVAATWERGYTSHFEALGFEHVHYMPLATDPALFHGSPAREHQRNVAFLGTAMIDLAAEAWEKVEELPEAAAAVREAFDEGRVTREAFSRGVETIISPDVLTKCDARTRRHVELCLVYEATKRLRTELVRATEAFGVEAFGDTAWLQITPKANAEVGYFDDTADFYRESAINLNSTSLQMATAVNQRVFDCPAAGGFLISDDQSDLDELFDADEVVTYGSLEELTELIPRYLADGDARHTVIERAQRRIAAHHTVRHRLDTLETFLKARFAD